MNYAIIENDVVVNIVVANEPLAENWVESNSAKIGDKFVNGKFEGTKPSLNDLIQNARMQRNFLLTKIDLINPIRWESFTEEQKNTLRNYRQDLLDVPQQKDFPNNIIWPILPKDLL